MTIDDSIDNGFVQVRRAILTHVQRGILTYDQASVFLWLLLLASADTGTLRASAKTIAQSLKFPGVETKPENSARSISGFLAVLQEKGYLTVVTPRKGSRQASMIYIHKYLLTRGPNKGLRTPSEVGNSPESVKIWGHFLPQPHPDPTPTPPQDDPDLALTQPQVSPMTDDHVIDVESMEYEDENEVLPHLSPDSAPTPPGVGPDSALTLPEQCPTIQEAQENTYAAELIQIRSEEPGLSARDHDNNPTTPADATEIPIIELHPSEGESLMATASYNKIGTNLTNWIFELLKVKQPPMEIGHYVMRFRPLLEEGYTVKQIAEAFRYGIQGDNLYWVNKFTDGSIEEPILYMTTPGVFLEMFKDYEQSLTAEQIKASRPGLVAAATARQNATRAQQASPDYVPTPSAYDQAIIDNVLEASL